MLIYWAGWGLIILAYMGIVGISLLEEMEREEALYREALYGEKESPGPAPIAKRIEPARPRIPVKHAPPEGKIERTSDGRLIEVLPGTSEEKLPYGRLQRTDSTPAKAESA